MSQDLVVFAGHGVGVPHGPGNLSDAGRDCSVSFLLPTKLRVPLLQQVYRLLWGHVLHGDIHDPSISVEAEGYRQFQVGCRLELFLLRILFSNYLDRWCKFILFIKCETVEQNW